MTGYPGAGKTHYRLNNDKFKDLPCVDIADIYKERPGTTPKEAMLLFLQGLMDLSDSNNEFIGEIVGTDHQMDTLRFFLEDWMEIEVVNISTPKDVCMERVKEALRKEPDSPYQQARLYILENMV